MCEARAELDAHADTCCVGAGFEMICEAVQMCSVEPFLESYSPVSKTPVTPCITAYDDANTSETFILQFHQALFFGEKLQNSLLNPNQIRMAGNIVNDCSKFLSTEKGSSHSIKTDEIEIPLELTGVISGFNVRTPTEAEKTNCTWVDMTDISE